MTCQIRFVNDYTPVLIDCKILEWKDGGVFVELPDCVKFVPYTMIREIIIKKEVYGGKKS